MAKAKVCKTFIQRFESARRLQTSCRDGGIGRRKGLKIPRTSLSVPVRFRLPVLLKRRTLHAAHPFGVGFFAEPLKERVMLSCVIFDMDGVISDSEPLHHQAERELLSPFGIQLTHDVLQSFTGMDTDAMLRHFIDAYHLSVRLEDLAVRHNRLLLRIFRERVRPIPNAVPLIRSLHESGLLLAVGSSSSPALIELVLDTLRIKSYFQAVVSGHDVDRGKPHPDIFLEIAAQLSLQPDRCVVIEDSKNGVEAAKRAGMCCVGFESPNSPNQDLSLADWIVDDLSLIRSDRLSERAECTASPRTK